MGLARIAARRPALTVAIVLAAALGGGILALGLKPSAGSDTFVSRSSSSYKASQADHEHFGSDAVVVLIKEPLPDLVETKDLATETMLEACLAGQTVVANQQLQSFVPAKPGSAAPYGGYNSPCGKLMRAKAVQVVYGPGTFLNRAVAAVNLQIEAMVRERQEERRQRRASRLPARDREAPGGQPGADGRESGRSARAAAAGAATRGSSILNSGISGTPRIDDPQFIPEIVFDQTRGVNQPKARFAYLFPTADSALIQVRLKASLSDQQQAQAISWIRQAVKMPMFRSRYGGTYTVTGEPVVVNDLASQITGSILAVADRGAAGDGGDAAARVQEPTAAAATRDRARRRRDHVRPRSR